MSTPKKLAVLVGCDYSGTKEKRDGCKNDVKIIEDILLAFDFLPENIATLIEPTKVDIQYALDNMRITAGVGDVLCFYFSGLVKVVASIPAIIPSDHQLIPATFFKDLANQLPDKTRFTLLLESSESARFIDPVDPNDKRILFSACQAKETAKRVVPDIDPESAFGMLTDAIKMALNVPDLATSITNDGLLKGIQQGPIEHYNQHPGLSCSDKNRNAPFLGYV